VFASCSLELRGERAERLPGGDLDPHALGQDGAAVELRHSIVRVTGVLEGDECETPVDGNQ
jgi:hypothetical protein